MNTVLLAIITAASLSTLALGLAWAFVYWRQMRALKQQAIGPILGGVSEAYREPKSFVLHRPFSCEGKVHGHGIPRTLRLNGTAYEGVCPKCHAEVYRDRYVSGGSFFKQEAR